MAKTCSICNRSYPDHLSACPHCEADRAEGVAENLLLAEDTDVRPQEPPKTEPPQRGAKVAAPPTHPGGDMLEVPPDEEPLEVAEAEAAASVAPAPAQPAEVAGAAEEVLEVAAEPPAKPAKVDSGVIDLEGTTLIDTPAGGSGPPSSDVLEVGAADVIESPSAVRVLEVTEAESEPPQKPAAPPTRMGAPTAAATMIADKQEADELPGSELGGPAAAGTQPPAGYQEPPTMQKPAAPPTRVAARSPAATMLSDKQEADEIAQSELGGPTGSRGLPNLELDSAKHKRRPAGAEEAIDLSAGDVLEATPASSGKDRVIDVADADLVESEDALEVTEGAGVEVVGDSSSAVDLGKKQAGKGEHPSGVDRIAAELESGMDLAGKGKKKKRTSEVDLGHVLEGPESSAVDLGASAPSPDKPKPESDVIDVGEAVEEGVIEDAIDEALLGERPSAKGKTTKPASVTADEDLVATATEMETGPEVVVPSKKGKTTKKEEEDEEPRPGRRAAPAGKGGGGRFLVGALCGLLVAGGAGAALYFSGVLGDKKAEGPKQPVTQQPPPPPPSSAALEAYGLVSQGKVDEALEKVKEAKDAEELVARGAARWQNYLLEQRKKNAPLDEKHEAVQQALKDFEEGKSTFYPNMIAETVKADRQARAREQQQAKQMQALAGTDKAVRGALAKVFPQKKLGADLGKEITSLAQELSNKTKEVQKLQGPAATLTQVANDLKVDADKVQDTVNKLIMARDDLATKLKDVNDKLAAAKIQAIKGTDGAGVQELVNAYKRVEEEARKLDLAVDAALAELRQGNLIPEEKDPKKRDRQQQLVEGLKKVRQTLNDLSIRKTGMALNETVEQRLDTWIALFRDRTQKDQAAVNAVANYAEWLNSDKSAASAETKAKALYARGLAERNTSKFDAAKKSLEAAAALVPQEKAPAWAAGLHEAREGLKDPTVHYLEEGRRLLAEGQLKEALGEVETGLQLFPNNGQLAALRGLVRFWLAAPGTMDKEIRADAALAQKDDNSKAEAAYVLGRLEERLGNWTKATALYREALNHHKGNDEEAMPYRRALGRLLLRDRSTGAVEQPAPKPPAPKSSRLAPAQGQSQAAAVDELRAALVVLLLTGIQQPFDPGEGDAQQKQAEWKEAEERANEMITLGAKLKDKKWQGEGHMIRGLVWYHRDNKTKGLEEYLKGLKLASPGKLPDDGEMIEALKRVIESHPGLQRPGSPERPNPMLAERHFGKGLDDFWARRFAAAEQEFAQAINYYDQDARYQYFLGLARWQQNTKKKREAAAWDFEVGARLEAQRRPHTQDINASLERVQGPVRQVLSNFRQKLGVGP